MVGVVIERRKKERKIIIKLLRFLFVAYFSVFINKRNARDPPLVETKENKMKKFLFSIEIAEFNLT